MQTSKFKITRVQSLLQKTETMQILYVQIFFLLQHFFNKCSLKYSNLVFLVFFICYYIIVVFLSDENKKATRYGHYISTISQPAL